MMYTLTLSLTQGYEEIKDIQIVQAGLYIYGLVPALRAATRREVGYIL